VGRRRVAHSRRDQGVAYSLGTVTPANQTATSQRNRSMRSYLRLMLTALLAALALAAVVATTNAKRIEVSNQNIRAVWEAASPMEFVGAFEVAIRCRLTVEGSFHSRTFSKVSGQLVGYLTRGTIGRPCTGGEVWVANGVETFPNGERPNTLPWHIQYISFSGALPRITRLRLSVSGFGLLVSSFGIDCLYLSTSFSPPSGELEINETTGEVTGVRPDETVSVPVFQTLSGICASGRFRGAGRVTQQGSTTTKIRVRLVQ
jgi:hypothetical protein